LTSLVTTPAVLLRSFAFGDTSSVLRFFTRDLGLVAVMAKGVRKSGARGGTGLESFAGGDLTVYIRSTRDLQTFKGFTPSLPGRRLGGSVLRFGGASLLGELVLKHGGEEVNPPLFQALENALDHVEASDEPQALAVVVAQAWKLVSVLGYRPLLDSCVSCGVALEPEETGRFDFSAGGVRCPLCARGFGGARIGPGARAQLAEFLDGGDVGSPLIRPRAHLRLLSDFITYHISGTRPLESFSFLLQVLPTDDA